MAILTEDMKRLVREQGLGFYATVCEDGSPPNLSPKGTTRVWDDDHLFLAEIRSPQTVANIRRGSLGEIEDRELRDAPLIPRFIERRVAGVDAYLRMRAEAQPRGPRP